MSAPRDTAVEGPGPIELSAVVPTHDGLRWLEGCLERLAAARRRFGLPDEVLVVDNGSGPQTAGALRARARREAWLEVLRLPENRGFAAGCNLGLEAARGRRILILNDDTLPALDLPRRLLEVLERQPRAGLVGPLSNYVKGRQQTPLLPDEGPEDPDRIAARLALEAGPRLDEVEQLAGLCLAAERAFFDEVGLFEEAYGLGNYEDDDLCLRARLAGWRLFIAPAAYCHHLGNKTFERLGLDYRAQLEAQQRRHIARWAGEPLFEAELALERGDHERLAEVLDSAPARGPGADWLLRAAARLAEARDDHALAAVRWRAFLDEHPLHAEGRCHYALCLLASGREAEGRREAARLMDEVHLAPPAAASLLLGLGRHERGMGRLEGARFFLARALEILPDFLPARNFAAVLHLEEGAYEAAERELRPFVERDDPDVLTNMGIVRFHQGKLAEARAFFARGAALAGPDSPAARNLASLDELSAGARAAAPAQA